MTTRDKLIQIIKDNYDIKTEIYYDAWTGNVEYTSSTLNVEELADAIIESGIFCDISKVGELLSEMFGGNCPRNYGFDKCWTKFAEAKLR